MSLYRCVLSFSVALTLVSGLAGCGGDDTNLRRQDVIGVWMESPSSLKAERGVMAMTTSPTNLRRLTFNKDRTFTLTICDPEGVPVDPPQTVGGKWWISDDAIRFKIRSRKLAEEYSGWVPSRFIKMRRKVPGQPHDTIDIRGADGVRVRYRRGE